MEIGPRIKAERERLSLSQAVLADHIGTTKRSVINWEGGAASPPAEAVARMAGVGADVLYILVGQRSQPVPEAATLGTHQRALLNSFELCTPAAQKQLLQLAALLAAGVETQTVNLPPGTRTQTINAPVRGHVAGGNVNIKNKK